MTRSARPLSVVLALGVLVALAGLPLPSAAAPMRQHVATAAHADADTLTILT